MAQRLYDPLVEISVTRNQLPKVLTAILEISPFVRRSVASIATPIYGDDVSSSVPLPDDASGSYKVVPEFRNLSASGSYKVVPFENCYPN